MNATEKKQYIKEFAKTQIEIYCEEKKLVSEEYCPLTLNSTGSQLYEVYKIIEKIFLLKPVEEPMSVVQFLGPAACKVLIQNGEKKYFLQYAQKVLNKLSSDRKTEKFFSNLKEEITAESLLKMEEQWN